MHKYKHAMLDQLALAADRQIALMGECRSLERPQENRGRFIWLELACVAIPLACQRIKRWRWLSWR